ncbi:MAG TPA: geranylgeranylglyceryl/heptaprenylglyceryl phosphate synthase [Methanomassiliicoccales archaeon]|nr:geranylgeranylglyceryl/heptaprenylglyceryl phosphate synthase [Methanomassiliicoccales archaeon]
MNVKAYIKERLRRGKAMHMTLIDPAKQDCMHAGSIAAAAERAGTDAIMVGGSTGVTQENLDATILSIKDKVKIPVIYFPSGAHAISKYADAIYFMSMLNSRNRKMIICEQVAAAPIVAKMGLETMGMGYVIVEPGMKVGEVGEADVVRRDDNAMAVAYGLAAQYMGMDLVYYEAGSGAPEPVPPQMVQAVKKNLRIPIIVGGGIRTPEQADVMRKAGADIIVTGTIVELGGYASRLESIIRAIKGR